jgi:hypothetical protein
LITKKNRSRISTVETLSAARDFMTRPIVPTSSLVQQQKLTGSYNLRFATRHNQVLCFVTSFQLEPQWKDVACSSTGLVCIPAAFFAILGVSLKLV